MLITPEYVREQQRLHVDKTYGAGSHRHGYLVAGIARVERCDTILDYGCGKGSLGNVLRRRGIEITEYDPAIPGKDAKPEPADLVTCLDVMEHIEPACLSEVITDLARLARKKLFVDISTKFTKYRWLSDGRNSHLLVYREEWWGDRFAEHGFKVLRSWNTGVRAWVALLEPP